MTTIDVILGVTIGSIAADIVRATIVTTISVRRAKRQAKAMAEWSTTHQIDGGETVDTETLLRLLTGGGEEDGE